MLTVASGKGGSGKTTTTLGLVNALDGPVFAVDADRDMPNLHTMAGVRRPVDATSGAPVREPSVRPHPTNSTVSVLPAPAGTDDDAFERWLRAATGDEQRTIVGRPTGAGPDAAVPLHAADSVVVVSPLCAPALHDTAKAAAMTWALGIPIVGCVISRSRMAPEVISDLMGMPVLGTVPGESSPVLTRPTVRVAYRRITDKIPGKK